MNELIDNGRVTPNEARGDDMSTKGRIVIWLIALIIVIVAAYLSRNAPFMLLS